MNHGEYLVTDQGNEINFAPATLPEEVLQNVRTILSTVQGSVPLDREFGIDPNLVDLPMPPLAKAKLTAEIIQKIRKYEPRCEVMRVTFTGDVDGKLVPTVQIRILDG